MKHWLRWAYDTRDLGEALRRARAERGLTQVELADRLGVTRMTVSRLENGDAVSLETALRALSECGYAIAVAPKFSQLRLEDPASSQATADTERASDKAEHTSRERERG